MLDESHFLIEDDSDVPSGTHKHYSFTGHLDSLNRRAWAMAGIQNKKLGFSPAYLQFVSDQPGIDMTRTWFFSC